MGGARRRAARFPPLLVNVYMHRFLRTWQERGMDRHLKAKVVSYADDCAPRRRRREAEMACY